MMLQRRELLHAGDDLARETGKVFVETQAGDRIEGRLARKVNFASGRYAVSVGWRPQIRRLRRSVADLAASSKA